jgi:hypothetical protein
VPSSTTAASDASPAASGWSGPASATGGVGGVDRDRVGVPGVVSPEYGHGGGVAARAIDPDAVRPLPYPIAVTRYDPCSGLGMRIAWVPPRLGVYGAGMSRWISPVTGPCRAFRRPCGSDVESIGQAVMSVRTSRSFAAGSLKSRMGGQ